MSKPVKPMFGVESEYAIAGLRGKKAMDREELVGQLMGLARRRLKHLPDTCSPSGVFLSNGARLYVDCGLHPEMTTPECTTPWDAARYIRAGERTLDRLAQEVQAQAGEGAEVMCFRCNVNYSGSGNTWGCHESYLHRSNPSELPDQLIPHLVTRIIYTGAGGFNPFTGGLQFCVAPRLMHIQQVISSDSTGNRGIFHTKNESLSSRGYNRLHILCGESLCSDTAIVLKIGVTALVVALADAGLKPGAGIQLSAPLDALREVATDTTCSRKLSLAQDREATAIEIQRALLRLAERHFALLPPWAPEICALWRRTLDQLEKGPDSVSMILDWGIKRRLFEDRARRSGMPWTRLGALSSVLDRINTALKNAGVKDREIQLNVLLGPTSPIAADIARIGHEIEGEGLSWADVGRFLAMRDEFYQIDTRFGQLGPHGIFNELDRLGVLEHKIAAVDDIDAAMTQPPSEGRARLRGEAIGKLSGQGGAKCNWMGVFGADGRVLNLTDPFAAEEVWTSPVAAPPEMDDMPFLIPEIETGDQGRLQQMLDAIRGRRGRTQTRDQGSV